MPRTSQKIRPLALAPVALAAACLLALSLCLLPSPADAQIVLQSTTGERLTESDLAKGPVIVVVWASWSPRGRDIVSKVSALADRWGSRARVVTVNFQEDPETVESFLAGQRMPVAIFLDRDGAFAKKHGVTALPGLLVFKDGRSAYRNKLPDDPDRVIGDILD